jgi:4-hydroxy-tetrahydrodipicolinate synthase
MNPVLWTAIVTPLTADGELSLTDFETLLRMQESAGNGIVILGSTGEGLNLSEEERRRIVAFTCSLNLTVPVICGVGGFDLPGTLTWLRYLETQRLDAYLMVTPLYSKPGEEGQYAWFSALLNTATRPCMLYNVPGRTGCSLNKEAVRRLASHPHFWAIKEASGSEEQFAAYVAAARDVLVFSGDDPLMGEFAPLGARGLVSVAGNIWPEATRTYVEMALAGVLLEEDIAIWKEASAALFIASNPVPVKTILMLDGHISTNTVKLPLHANDMPSSHPLIEISRRVRNWHEQHITIPA